MAIYFTLAKPLQRLPKPVAIIVDMYHDVKHMVFKGKDELCTVSDNDHSVVGHLEDLAVDTVYLIPYLVLALALVVGALYLPALVRGMTLPAINNPVPNVPANTVPLQPSMTPTVVIPTATDSPTLVPPTSTITPTETPTFQLPPINLDPMPWYLASNQHGSCVETTTKEDFVNNYIPALRKKLPVDWSQGWGYRGYAADGINYCWMVSPWPEPKTPSTVTYWIRSDGIQAILEDTSAYYKLIGGDVTPITVPDVGTPSP